jgi:hypothetical protein
MNRTFHERTAPGPHPGWERQPLVGGARTARRSRLRDVLLFTAGVPVGAILIELVTR